jgi:hypothetical protein
MTYENPNITLIDISGNALSAAPGSAVPTSGLAIVGSDGTNARFLSTDTSGRLIVISNATDNTTNVTTKLPVIVAVANTAAPTYTSGNMVPLSVDTSGNLRITGSISATNPSVSTTGSAPPASATYIGGSVTTAAPTYTTGQLNALSLTTAGALRIDGSAVTQPVSGTITANAGTGSFTVAQATAANLNATVVGSGNFTVVQPTAANLNATVTGTVTANQGGAPWSQNITQFGGSAVVTGTGASGAGIPRVTVSNDSNIAATQSGTWVVSATQATATNLNALVSQGPQAVLANAWPIKITDATNGPVAIKAASTAAAATDPSLVVGFSPNSPLPTGSNTIGVVNQGTGNATVSNAWFSKITDGVNGTVGVKPGSTAPTGTEPTLVVVESPNSPLLGDTLTSGTLGALNASVTIVLSGKVEAGFQIAAGTLIGTIVAEITIDGGTTWNTTYIDQLGGNKVSSITFSSANTATAGTIVGVGGSGSARIRVSAYTSGTCNISLRATSVQDPSTLFGGTPNATVQPPTGAQIGGWDGSTFRIPSVKAASTVAAATDQSLVVALSPNSHVKATVSPLFTGSANTLTATLASLATGSARSSAAVNNTSNLYEDVLIFVTITPPTTGVSGTGYVNVFGYGSLDGTNFPESGVGTDAAATISSPANLPLLAQITVNANSGTRASFKYGPFSFCRTFGLDRLPPYWGVVVQNNCGAALAASGQSITYLPVNGQLV